MLCTYGTGGLGGTPVSRHALALVATAAALVISLTGCSGGGAGSGDTGDAQDATNTNATAATLTKDSVPTEVGTTWSAVRSDGASTPVEFRVEGPWEFEAGADWSESQHEIVDPAGVPGIEKFEDVTFVVKSASPGNPVYYYPRRLTDEWVVGLGRITMQGDAVTPEPAEPSNFWPLNLEVGKEYEVSDAETHKTVATVLARNRATVPAGTYEDTYLVRFRSTLKTSGSLLDNYYLLAPGAGQVAWLSELDGTEEAGFTSAGSIVLLKTPPAK